jgi:sporadic carbohydrate cluster protein (TIGR04323 family)
MIKARGYVSSIKIDGSSIPQQVQNIAIKEYCQKKKFHYLLSSVEYSIPDSIYSISEALNENFSDIIVYYSLFQLPVRKSKRFYLYKKILKKKKVHFAIENLQIEHKSDLDKIEKIIIVNQFIRDKFNINNLKNIFKYIEDGSKIYSKNT